MPPERDASYPVVCGVRETQVWWQSVLRWGKNPLRSKHKCNGSEMFNMFNITRLPEDHSSSKSRLRAASPAQGNQTIPWKRSHGPRTSLLEQSDDLGACDSPGSMGVFGGVLERPSRTTPSRTSLRPLTIVFLPLDSGTFLRYTAAFHCHWHFSALGHWQTVFIGSLFLGFGFLRLV